MGAMRKKRDGTRGIMTVMMIGGSHVDIDLVGKAVLGDLGILRMKTIVREDDIETELRKMKMKRRKTVVIIIIEIEDGERMKRVLRRGDVITVRTLVTKVAGKVQVGKSVTFLSTVLLVRKTDMRQKGRQMREKSHQLLRRQMRLEIGRA